MLVLVLVLSSLLAIALAVPLPLPNAPMSMPLLPDVTCLSSSCFVHVLCCVLISSASDFNVARLYIHVSRGLPATRLPVNSYKCRPQERMCVWISLGISSTAVASHEIFHPCDRARAALSGTGDVLSAPDFPTVTRSSAVLSSGKRNSSALAARLLTVSLVSAENAEPAKDGEAKK